MTQETEIAPVARRTVLIGGMAALASSNLAGTASAAVFKAPTKVDANGRWRWSDGREVALFGVNYGLASAAAFRTAKARGLSFDTLIDADFTHFRRLGFDALRLCFWGDWENTTGDGHLVVNEHLRVLDKIVARAARDGISCLLSPIVTYDAAWPDAMDVQRAGIITTFGKDALGTNPAAITAQARYLGELLSRTNSVNGRRYADESAIIAVEPINEPTHHSADHSGSIRYINALAGAVRGSGFRGPIFYNVTQDMAMAPAIGAADVQGATFAWYPTGLQPKRAITGNGLLLVDDYTQFDNPSLKARAKLVYEFDAAASMASYFYPAIVREFRRGSAQFASMFSYDSHLIAASNTEMNDHLLNLAYTPSKAISALIAATAMRELPLGKDYGSYPSDMRFGSFRVDDRENLSELVDERRFIHSNSTTTRPPSPSTLDHLAGCGSSPIVEYDGTGAWFLDKVEPGTWRLEIYPDAAVTGNPFVFRRPDRAAVRIIQRQRRFVTRLPDLGARFGVTRPDRSAVGTAQDGAIVLVPGVYCLSRTAPQRVDPTYHAPPGEAVAPIIQHQPPASLTVGKPWPVALQIVATVPPKAVALYIRTEKGFTAVPLSAAPGFGYRGTVPAGLITSGFLDYYVGIEGNSGRRIVPPSDGTWPGDFDFPTQGGFRVPVLGASAPLVLFDAGRHGDAIDVPYGGSQQPAFGKISPSVEGRPALRLDGTKLKEAWHNDIPAQFAWDGPLDTQGRDLAKLNSVTIAGRSATSSTGRVMVILIERDGTSWGQVITLTPEGGTVRVPVSAFAKVQAAMLPRDYPIGINPYWLRDPGGAGRQPKLADLQAVQCTLGSRFLNGETPIVDVESVSLCAG